MTRMYLTFSYASEAAARGRAAN